MECIGQIAWHIGQGAAEFNVSAIYTYITLNLGILGETDSGAMNSMSLTQGNNIFHIGRK